MRIPPTLLGTCVLMLQWAFLVGCGSPRSTGVSSQTPTETPTVNAVKISASSTSVQAGKTLQVSATATYSDNSSQDVTGAATWTSSNTSIATVKAGQITGGSAGTAQITVAYNGVASGAVTVTVNPPDVPTPTVRAVTVSASSTSVQTGATLQLSATATYSDNSSKDVTGAATWSSSNTSVATVKAGVVTGVSAGTTQITASFSGVAGAAVSMTVNPPVTQTPTLSAVKLSASSTSVQVGKTVSISAIATYSDNSSKDVTSAATWTSSNTSVATAKAGTITGVSAGTVQITASYNGVASGAVTVTVNSVTATLQSIQISGSTSVGAGASVQLKAIGTYSDKTTKDITTSASWTCSPASVATVQAGLLNGLSSGTASVAAALNGVTGSTSVSITSGYVVQIDPSMSQTEIQDAINGSHTGDTIAFAAGTYNLTVPGLKFLAGRTYLGSTSGASVLSGTGGYSLVFFYGTSLTLQNFVFDGGGLYLGGPVSDVHIEQNTFQNINAPYTNWTTEICIFMDTSVANSDISHNTFKNIGANLQNKFVDEVFSAGMLGYGLSNTTIEYNTFDTFTEGIHIFYNNLDGKNVHINHNTFVRQHRIAIEQQNGQNGHAGGLEVAYNHLSEPLNAWALTYGLSIAATSDSGTGISVHDNFINADTPVAPACTGSGCYYPYGIEAWGTGTQVYNNTVEGLWEHGVSIGAATNLSVTNNAICGPNMAAHNSFVDYEYGSEPGTVISGNTTSAAMTCGTGN